MTASAPGPGQVSQMFSVPDDLQGASGFPGALIEAAGLASEPSRGALPLRIREIVAVAVLAWLGDPGVAAQMRRALAAGATIRQITEALLTICTPGGQLCLARGLPHLTALVGEPGARTDERPSNPVLARTGRDVTPPSAWPWLEEHYPDYQAIRSELNRLTFMPEDAALEPRYREILVAVVLCCRPYPTVLPHARRAIEEGATLAELVEAVNLAALIAGATVFGHAVPALTRIHDEIEAGVLGPR